MMQEPHCLNTSILDCSVTFTVDKDVCIHGIEVPSQVTEAPENLELPMLQNLAAAAAGAADGQQQQNSSGNNSPQAQPPAPNPGGGAATSGSEYNELLYAHLLDAEGSRLTYTHFTAKVKS